MKTGILTWMFIVIISGLAAVGAYPGLIDFIQPDGSHLEIYMKGDEKVRWAQTPDAYSLVFNADGFYEYAMHDGVGDMVPSGIIAKPEEQRTNEERQWLASIPKRLGYSSSQKNIIRQIWDLNDRQTRAFPATGERKLICILMGFADRPFTKSQAQFQDLFNQVGYTNDGAQGSVKDYYHESSYNQLILTTDVAGPFTASQNMVEYGGEDGDPRQLVLEAINFADPTIDFSEYDNDNNGWVDGIFIIFAGYGEEAGGPEAAIWSHAWGLANAVTRDGVQMSAYACSPELRGNSGSGIVRVGVICHEFGHTLGAPDFYDTNYEEDGEYQGLGNWDLMSSGNWNNGGISPAHHNGLIKVRYYQWAEYNYMTYGGDYTLQSAETNSNSFMRYDTSTSNEYFVLENRSHIGFDASIPGEGMIIYHVHSQFPSIINHTHPQRMYPVSQNASMDPNSDPASYGVINSATCAWTGSNKTFFTDTSVPSSKSWAGENTNKPITSISFNPSDRSVSFVFMGGDPDANYWTGNVSTDWFTAANWSRNMVPNGSHNVVVPSNLFHNPSISGQNAACKNLHISINAKLGIGYAYLQVYENFESYGELILATESSYLLVSGDITWNSFSEVQVWNSLAGIHCKGGMTFEEGSNVQMLEGSVTFFSGGANPSVDQDGYILNRSTNTILPTVISNKENSYELVISALSTQDFTINGSLICYQNRSIRVLYGGIVTLKGNLNSENTNSAGIYWNNGTLRLAGTNHSINIPNLSGYLNHLTLANNGNVTINHNLRVKGDLLGISMGDLIINCESLSIDGNFQTGGATELNHAAAQLSVAGSMTWLSGSTFVISSSAAMIRCKGSMTFNTGSLVNMTQGTVDFYGNENAEVINKSYSTKFNNLKMSKMPGYSLGISSSSTAGFQIRGSITVAQGSVFNNQYSGIINLRGDITTLNTSTAGLTWNVGTVTLTGVTQTITLAHSSDRVFNVILQNGTSLFLASDISIQGNLDIFGTLNAGSYTLKVGGDWSRISGGVFNAATSTVIFNGSGIQNVDTCTFNILRLNKMGDGVTNKLVIGTGEMVTVASYKHDAGIIQVSGGYFLVQDLADNNVKGSYSISSGSISLTQDSTYFVDLDADFNISGGRIEINGGYNFPVDWAYTRPVSITMSGGELDFKNNSIGLTNTGHALTLNLTGGIIKTGGSFTNGRTGLNFGGGSIEMTGSGDTTLSSPGGALYDVKINKSGSRDRANKVTISSNVSLSGDLNLNVGTLMISGGTVNIGRDLILGGTFQMLTSGVILNVGRDILVGAASNVQITNGTINLNRHFTQLLNSPLVSAAQNTINFVGSQDSNLTITNPSASLGSIGVNKSSGNVMISTAAEAVNLLGSMTVNTGNQFWFRTIPTNIAGNLNVYGAILLQAGGSVSCNNLNMYGNITVAGDLSVQNTFYQAGATQLIVTSSGNFIIDKPYTGSYQSFAGTTILNGGAITITNEGIQFGASSSLTINSGTLRIGWGLRAMVENSFHMSTGTIEFIGNRSASIQLAVGNYLNNVAVSKTGSGTVMLASDLLLRDLNVNSGTFQMNHHTINISGNLNIMGGNLNAAFADDLINLTGWWNNNAGTTGFTQGLGTVSFEGIQRSVIYQSEQYNNLRINKTGSYPDCVEIETGSILSANSIDFVDGTLYLKGGATLNTPVSGLTLPGGCALRCDPSSASTINLSGDFADTNTMVDDNNGFSSGMTTINVTGSGDRNLNPGTYPPVLHGLNVNLSSGTFYVNSSNVRFTGEVFLLSGNLQVPMGGTLQFDDDLQTSAGTNISSQWASIILGGNTDSVFGMQGTGDFSSIMINKASSGQRVTLSSNWTSPSWCSVTIQRGSLDLNSHNLLLTGSIYVNDGAELEVDSGSGLYLGSGNQLQITDGGRLAVIGTSAVPALISRVGTGYYSLNVNQGGTIAAADAIFEYMDAYGVNVASGALVDPSFCFAGCTFRNGASGGSLIVLNNEQLLSIPNAIFPANTWGGNKNVNKYINAGGVNLINASGAFSGSSFEHDPYTRINWNSESPSIQVSQNSLTFADTPLTMTDVQSFSISNTGSGTLIGSIVAPDDFSVTLFREGVAVSGVKTTQDIRVTDYDFIVTPNSTLSVQVTFNPTLPVSYSSYLQITHNADSATQSLHLSGTGVGPRLALDPELIAKGILPDGSHTEMLQISNTGNTALSYYATIEYGGRDRSVILAESFESTIFPPPNWIISDMAGTEGNWLRSMGTSHPSGISAQDGQFLAYFNSWTAHIGHNTLLQTGYVDFSAYENVSLSFWMFHEAGYQTALDRVQIMVNNNQQWTNVGEPVIRPQAPYGEWRQHTVSLNQFAGLSYVRVAFLGISEYGNDIHIDNVVITGSNPPTGWVFLDGQGSTASGVLASGGSNTHYVSLYTYGMDPGIYQAAINVATNDPIAPLKTIPIEVSVGTPGISVSASSLSFGNRIIGSEAVQSFSITATGDLHLNGTITVPTGFSLERSTRNQSDASVLESANDRWVSSMDYLLEPGETQTYQLRFIPTLMQNYGGQVNISSDHLALQTIQLSGTGANVPAILTLAATAITSTSATLNAQITSTGNLDIWGRGFRYGTDPDPITNGNDYMVASSNNTYSAFPTGFSNGLQIYFCAFAYNELGWSYGSILSFTTLGPTVTVSETSLPGFGFVKIGESSSPQSFILEGHDLSSQITLTAPDGFRIALDSRSREGRSPGNQLLIDPVGGIIPATQIMVYFEPNDTGVYGSCITIMSPELSTQTVDVSGTGINLALVSLQAVTDVSQTGATSVGFVSADGSAAVTSRGVCWSENPDPSIVDPHTEDGAGTGAFVSIITGLTPGTHYFIRAYATNLAGTVYSDESFFITESTPVISASASELPDFGNVILGQSSDIQMIIVAGSTLTGMLHITASNGFQISTDDRDIQRTFSSQIDLSPISGSVYETILVRFNPSSGGDYNGSLTLSSPGAVNVAVTLLGRGVTLPTVTTMDVTEISATSALTGGMISSNGWMDIIACGVCWSDSPYPNLEDEHTSNTDLSGEFVDQLTDLEPNTTYYVRAYASNGVGIAYGNQRVFTTTVLAPGIPQNLSLVIQASGLLLSWDPVTNAASYHVYRTLDPQSLDWGLPVASTVNSSWVDTSGGARYFYKVTALSE